MADITVTPTGRLGVLNQSTTIRTDISVTLIGQSLTLARAPSSALGFAWSYDNDPFDIFLELTLSAGFPTVLINNTINITGQSLSLNRGSPIIYDFVATTRLLTLAQGTPSLIINDGNIAPVGRQLLLNQSPNIATDLTYTTVGQSLSLGRGTPTTALTNETIVSIVGQALSLGRGDPVIASTVIIINPSSQLAHFTQSPNIVEERLLNLIGQDLRFAQGTPTVTTLIDPGTIVNLVGQQLNLYRGVPDGVVATFIPISRQLTFSIPQAIVRTDRIEEIDGRTLTLNQGTPTVVSIPGVTNIFGITLVLSRGIPVVTILTSNSVAGQVLALSQGTVTVAISADNTVSISGQQLVLNQGTVSTTIDISVIIPGLDLFLSQGVIDVQDGVTVSVPIAGRQLTLSQGNVAVTIDSEAVDVEILGLDLIFNQGSIHITSTSINEEIAQEGIDLILNQGSVCVSIFDMGVGEGDSVYDVEIIGDLEYIYSDGGVNPTYIPEHCD